MMQVRQMLMFDDRTDFYNWLIKSDIAMTSDELKANENKKHIIIPPNDQIVEYIDYVNYFNCDSLQTLAWKTESEESDNPKVSLVPIYIESYKYDEKYKPCKCDD